MGVSTISHIIKLKEEKKKIIHDLKSIYFFLSSNSEHIVVHVPYNVHTHNIHHHHIQPIPVYKHVTHVKHVPVHVQVCLLILWSLAFKLLFFFKLHCKASCRYFYWFIQAEAMYSLPRNIEFNAESIASEY